MQQAKLIKINKAQLDNGDILSLPCTVNYYYIINNSQAMEAVEEILLISSISKNMIAVDVETTGFDPYINDILLLQIGIKEDVQYIFDIRQIDKKILMPILTSPCWKVGHNIKFDAKFIKTKFGIKLTKLYDTFIAEKILRCGEDFGGDGYALDAVTRLRVGRELKIIRNTFASSTSNINSDKAKKYMQKSFLDVGPNDQFSDAQLAYAAQDVASKTIFDIVDKQVELLCEERVNILYDPEAKYITDAETKKQYEAFFKPKLRLWETAKLEFKFLEVVIDLELNGINFSKEKHTEVLENIVRDYKAYRSDFLKLLGKYSPQKTLLGTASVNPDSQPQVLAALNFLHLKLEDTKEETLDSKLKELKEGTEAYKIVQTLLNYRTMSKLVSTYGESLVSKIHPATNRIHYDIKQIVDTGRISTSDPNLQNIPSKIENWRKTGDITKDLEIDKRIGLRECFIAPFGYTMVIADYDSQELRVAASISRDLNMLQAFKEKKNLHCYSATLMYDEDYDDFYSKFKMGDPQAIAKRKEAKTVSFGSLYGSGPPNLSRVLKVSLEKATDILERFWMAYQELKKAMIRYAELSNQVGYSNTILGRRRYYPGLFEKIKWVQYEKNIGVISKRAQEAKIFWLFEKHGEVTKDNYKLFREAIVKKYKSAIGRQASNHTIQGSSADMLKKSSIKIYNELLEKKLDAKMVGLVHDEILVECKEDIAEQCKEIVKRNMEEAMLFFCPNVPAIADCKISNYWKK